MRRAIFCTLSVIGLLAFAGCKKQPSATGEQGPGGNGEIVIGEYGSMSGKQATFGQSTNEGIMLAIDQINAAGGVLGKQVRVISYDDEGSDEEAVAVVKKLIDRDQVLAVLGEVASKNSLAGGGICEHEHVPMISPSSTNPQVTQNKKYVFRVCFTDDFQGSVAAKFAIQNQKWKRVAVFTCADQDYSKKLSQFFKEAYANNGQIVADEKYETADEDYTAQLTRIQSTNPDAVYLPGYYNNICLILKQARSHGLMAPFFGGDGWDSAETLKLGPVADGCFFTNHYSPDDTRASVQAFIGDFKAKYNGETPDAMAITGYDAARVLCDSIRRAGKLDRDAITDAIAQTKDFPGAGGSITIDQNHNARKPIAILEILDGKTHLAQMIQPE
jgi:branched-chain amino acid transport system substrate-binding protein